LRTWQVFPFDFSAYAFDWTWVARVLIVIAAVGSGIAVVANLIGLVRPSSTRAGTRVHERGPGDGDAPASAPPRWTASAA
jgi:hypothetical protein